MIDLVGDALVIDMLSVLGMVGKRAEAGPGMPDEFTAAEVEAIKASGVTVFHLTGSAAGRKAREQAYRNFARSTHWSCITATVSCGSRTSTISIASSAAGRQVCFSACRTPNTSTTSATWTRFGRPVSGYRN